MRKSSFKLMDIEINGPDVMVSLNLFTFSHCNASI